MACLRLHLPQGCLQADPDFRLRFFGLLDFRVVSFAPWLCSRVFWFVSFASFLLVLFLLSVLLFVFLWVCLLVGPHKRRTKNIIGKSELASGLNLFCCMGLSNPWNNSAPQSTVP